MSFRPRPNLLFRNLLLGACLLLASRPFLGAQPATTVVVTTNTVWTNLVYVVEGDLVVSNGATLAVAGGATVTVSGELRIVGNNTVLQCQGMNRALGSNGVGVVICAGNLAVGAGARLSADGWGYQGTSGLGLGPGAGGYAYSSGSYGGGAGHGGKGGSSYSSLALGGGVYGVADEPVTLGSSGGYGYAGGSGAGGGAMRLEITNQLALEGIISANGSNAVYASGGGGAGGSVYVRAGQLAGSGRIQADGGNGYSSGGGGGGGRVAVYYQSAAFTNWANCTAKPGTGYGTPEAGSVQFYDEGATNLYIGTYWELATGMVAYAQVTLGTNAVLTVRTGAVLSVEQMVLGSNAVVQLLGGTLQCAGTMVLPQNGRLVVTNGARLMAGELGFSNGAMGWIEGGTGVEVSGTLWLSDGVVVQCLGRNRAVGSNGVGVVICASNLVVGVGARLSADGWGYPGTWTNGLGLGAGGYLYSSGSYGGGAGHGGKGGSSYSSLALGGGVYGVAAEPVTLGSSGGYGYAGGSGAGGGAMRLEITNQLALEGIISANGSNAVYASGGGGAGGSVYVRAGQLAGSGRIQADGGNGYSSGGGGGGGRVAVYYQSAAFTNWANCTAKPGTGYGTPEAGSVQFYDVGATNLYVGTYWELATGKVAYAQVTLGTNAVLTVRTGAVLSVEQMVLGSNAAVQLLGGTLQCAGTMVVPQNGRLVVTNGARLAAGELGFTNGAMGWIEGGTGVEVSGTLWLSNSAVVQCVGRNRALGSNGVGVVICANNLAVGVGARLSADGGGYPGTSGLGLGPGAGGYISSSGSYGGGAGHGGKGGNSYSIVVLGGGVYGSATEPVALGSSGGYGGAGGGAIRLEITNELTLEGLISANGSNALNYYGGGGSGGSVHVRAGQLTGNGVFQADGGNGKPNAGGCGGGGGGGRVAVYYQSGAFSNWANCTARGGSGVNWGEAGSVQVFDLGATNLYVGTYWELATGAVAYAQVALEANAVLTLRTGAVLNVAQMLLGSNAVVQLLGGTLQCAGTMVVPQNGRLVVTNGAHLVAGELGFANGATGWIEGGTGVEVSGTLWLSNSAVVQCVGRNRALGSNGVGVVICANNLAVGAGGRLSADGGGYPGTSGLGLGPGAGGYISSSGSYGGGAGHGGKGGNSYSIVVLGGGVYGSATEPVALGSSGGYGGAGGGAIRLEITNQLALEGLISANGSNALSYYGGGGSGGSVYVRAGQLTGNGVFQADGGNGKPNGGSCGGGGGGGRVAVYYQSGAFTNWANCTARGGSGVNWGEAGSVQFYDEGATNLYIGTYWELATGAAAYAQVTLGANAVLTVRTGAVLSVAQMVLGSNAAVQLPGGTLQCAGAMVVPQNGRLVVTNGARLMAGELGFSNGAMGWIEGGTGVEVSGTLWLSDGVVVQCLGRNRAVGSNGVGVVICASNLVVGVGARLSADAGGYPGTSGLGLGPGAGGCLSSGGSYGGGAGHGGKGGNSSGIVASGGGVYGSATEPVALGSSGGYGGAGGGAIRLEITNQLTLEGLISANGSNALSYYGGGGSGGSVYVRAGQLTGNGVFQADGGNGKPNGGSCGGGGGGGRVAVYYQSGAFTNWADCTARGGSGVNWGEAGSVQFYDEGATNLYIGTYWELATGAAAYAQVTLGANAVLTVRTGAVLSVAQMVLGNNAAVQLPGGTLQCAGAMVVPQNGRLVVTNGARLMAGELGFTNGAMGWVEGGTGVEVSGTLWLSDGVVVQCLGRNRAVGSNGVGVVICASNLVVGAAARLSADGWGYPGTWTNGLGLGAGGYVYSSGSYGGGAGHGGKGGNSSGIVALGGGAYGSATEPVALGSSGGYGGAGGGAIRLEITNQLVLEGVVSANGSNAPSYYGGGGAGGSVYVRAGQLTGNGRFQADGGNGYSSGGGAGGGRVAVYYQSGGFTNWANCTARGGSGANLGEVGSVQFYDLAATNLYVGTYWELATGAAAYAQVTLGANAVLTVRTGAVVSVAQMVLGSNAAVQLPGGTLQCAGAMVVPQNGRLVVTNGARLVAGELGFSNGAMAWIEGGTGVEVSGTLWLSDGVVVQCVGRNRAVGSNGVGVVICASNLVVGAAARLSADGWGYPGTWTNGLGLGAGSYVYSSGSYGGGAGHGGKGGNSSGIVALGGGAYGSATEPVALGSSGGYGGAGGGAIRLEITNQLVLEGVVSANGSNAPSYYGGGGAGGSVYVRAGQLTGNGRFQADGGNGYSSGGGAGGGRVAAYYQSGGFTNWANCTTKGGSGANSGEAGTLVRYDGNAGTLYVSGNCEIGEGIMEIPGLTLLSNAILTVRTGAVVRAEAVEVQTGATLRLWGGALAASRGVTVNQGTLQVKGGAQMWGQDLVWTNGASGSVEAGSTLNASGTLLLSASCTLYCEALNRTASNGGVGPTLRADTVVVAAGGKLSAEGRGYYSTTNRTGGGPGGGGFYYNSSGGKYYGGGGGYGSVGGNGYGSASGGGAYGSAAAPVDLGSAGGNFGGNGGGAIRLEVTNTLLLEGEIMAAGSNGDTYSGGGAGGSLLVYVHSLRGAGRFTAEGGAGGMYGGGGGGGRIAVYALEEDFPSSVQFSVAGGGGANPGQAGTVFTDALLVSPETDLALGGYSGGPFNPTNGVYGLTNASTNALLWTAQVGEAWASVWPAQGLLGPNAATQVVVALSSTAYRMVGGTYRGSLLISNATSLKRRSRNLTLSVVPRARVFTLPETIGVTNGAGGVVTRNLRIGNAGTADGPLSFTLLPRETGRSAQLSGSLPRPESIADDHQIILDFTFPEPEVQRGVQSDRVTAPELKTYRRTGAPLVPVHPVDVLLPLGKTVAGLEVIELDKERLGEGFRLAPAQQPYPLSFPELAAATPPDPAIYEQAAPWPGVTHERLGLHSQRGYHLAKVNLFPLQYSPVSGEILWCRKMRVVVTLADGGQDRVWRPTPQTEDRLARRVANPGTLASYRTVPSVLAPADSPLTLPGGGPYKYVIITSQELAGSPAPWNFQALCAAKLARGVSATLVTTEWIYANYSGTRPDGGSDNQTRLRNFLIEAYRNWGTENVLLGGGHSVVPARFFWVQSWQGEDPERDTMPSDWYYACVDPAECTFDGNKNGSYGEPTDGPGGQDIDLHSEIGVGRAPVHTAEEVANFVRKTLGYETAAREYLSRIVMLGEYLGFKGASDYATGMMEQIRQGGNYDGYSTYGFTNCPASDYLRFDTSTTLYDRSGYSWPKSALLDLMNRGVHVFNHLGHANQTIDMKLRVGDLPALTNTDCFLAYSQGCLPGAFDQSPCFAEVITTMEHGAFAALMNARYGWGAHDSTDGPSERFDRQFWDAVLGERILQLGRANQDSKEDNVWDINGDCIRWCLYEINLFGDPELSLRFVDVPPWLKVSVASGAGIAPGYSTNVVIEFSSAGLKPGRYDGLVVLSCNDPQNSQFSIPVSMRVQTNQAPVITRAPASQTVVAGSDVSWQVEAYGDAPMGYAWLLQGTNLMSQPRLTGLSSNVLALANVQPGEAGLYAVVLTNSSGSVTSPAALLQVLEPPTFTLDNSNSIQILDAAVARPYPSQLGVSGLPGTLSQVSVSLHGFSHTWPRDVRILLVGPQGQRVVLLSDAGGDQAVGNVTLTFQEGMPKLPQDDLILPGIYAPSSYDPAVFFPAPAPAEPAEGPLSVFKGTNPNGTWSLYGVDNEEGEEGVIARGWSLTLALNQPLAITQQPQSQQVVAGASLALSVTAVGAPPLTFRWQRNTADLFDDGRILGADSPTLLLANARESDAGAYTVVVSSPWESATSSPAWLSVLSPNTPAIRPETARRLPNGRFQFEVLGANGQTYDIQATTNLKTWKTLQTLVLTNGVAQVTDPATNYAQRFYRVKWVAP